MRPQLLEVGDSTRPGSTAAAMKTSEKPISNMRSRKRKQLHFQSPLATRYNISPRPLATISHASKLQNVENPNAITTRIRNRLLRGCSSFMYACQHGDIVEVLAQIRSQPERIRQRDRHNKSALHYCAAQSPHTSDLVAAASIATAAPELVESADEDGFTPLHLAVIQGNLAMVNLLLANKADVNAVDNEGHSVVHWATVCGEVEALRSVLLAGGNVVTPDINGGSPLHYAVQMCGSSYEGKLSKTNSTKLALEILSILLEHPQCSVDGQDKDGRQPLLWAASAGSAKAVIALMKAGARVESADKDGLTALHCAASRGHTECIDTLISLCGAPTDLIDTNGCTALHYAVTLGHADATARLLDLEADPNRQDRKGRTPAHCGCSKGQFETVKMLTERGANLWLRNAKGDLPVHEAASSGRRELVEWLLEQRPKQVNTTSNDGRSLLHIAAANDFTDMCKVLLDFGADINAIHRNSKGAVITPLDCALQRGNRSTAKFLQSNGGKPAGKLRLAVRQSNPFHDTSAELVLPLKHVEKEEYHDLRNSKKYIVYLKRSDSDCEGENICNCTEETYSKEQRHSHGCRRHRHRHLRRRTSSCGEPKPGFRSKHCSKICRSKSNIEIRRRASQERYASSSEFDEDEDEDDESSCENCCYHKRQKQRVLQKRRSSSLKRSSDRKDSDQEDEPQHSDKHSKSAIERSDRRGSIVEIVEEKKQITRPNSKVSTQGSPRSAIEGQTAQMSASKEGTFIKSPPQSAKCEENVESKMAANATDFTDDDEPANRTSEMVTTQVDVHRSADDISLKLPEEAGTNEKVNAMEVSEDVELAPTDLPSEDIIAVVEQEEDRVLQSPAMALDTDSKIEETPQGKIENSEKEISEEKIEKQVEELKSVEAVHVEDEKIEDEIKKITCALLTEVSEIHPTSPVLEAVSPAAETAEPANVPDASKEAATTVAVSPEIAASTTALSQSATTSKIESADAEGNTNMLNPIAEAATASIQSEEITTTTEEAAGPVQDQGPRRSFTLLPTDSADDEEVPIRKSSFQVLNSDESADELGGAFRNGGVEFSAAEGFKIVADAEQKNAAYEDDADESASPARLKSCIKSDSAEMGDAPVIATGAVTCLYDHGNEGGRKRRLKKRVKSGTKTRTHWNSSLEQAQDAKCGIQQSNKDQDSGFEPSPRITKSKIPTPNHIYAAQLPRRPIYATLDGRSCISRSENRKPGDRGACNMSAVTRSIQRNIRRYYMERKIFQHLLELKSLQIRSNKLNEATLVKRAIDDYHKSCADLGGETGTRLRRYTFTEYTFKNFELFLYETLKSLQKPGTYNFQNINEVYEEAERRLSPDYNAYEKALQCTTKTHRCLHAAHAYTGIPCAAYIPMMNHHTMPKFGFGAYKKTGVGSFYLPKILSSGTGCGGKVALELSHGKSKQLIPLPSEKLDSNKRYYVTFTVKETGSGGTDKQQSDVN